MVCVGLALGGCSDSPDGAALLGGVHQELLLDGENVQLLDGFDEFTALEIWKEYLERFNLDRDELPLLVPRPSRFVWELNGRAGVFVAQAARYHSGGLADDAPCTVTVTALAGGAPIAEVSATWELPAMPADDGQSDVVGHREGQAMSMMLAFPQGTEALEVSVRAEVAERLAGEPAAPANYVTLLSPRIDRKQRRSASITSMTRASACWPWCLPLPQSWCLSGRAPQSMRAPSTTSCRRGR